jgi:hypothetical protein
MADWMNQTDTQDAAIRQDIGALRSDIKADTAEFRHQTETEFVTVPGGDGGVPPPNRGGIRHGAGGDARTVRRGSRNVRGRQSDTQRDR